MLKLLLNKHSRFVCRIINAAPALIIFSLLTAPFGCGKRKMPSPPVERVSQNVQISGFQRGGQIQLAWSMPARNAAADNLLNIAGIDVYRLTEPLANTLVLSEEEFSSRATLIAVIPVSKGDFALKKFTYTDKLKFAGQQARLIYAVRLVNSAGQKASFSNFLTVEPSGKIAQPPQTLTAAVMAESIKLNWTAPESNVDGSRPANILGYNIYRSDSSDKPAKLLNEKPSNESEYSDKFFEFNSQYFYFVRSVSVDANGAPAESLESNIISVVPRDVFKPSAPSAITIAAAPSSLSIFFATNPEKDVAGYRIYRTADKEIPLKDWQNLTPELLTTNTFQDKSVESGKTYYYYLIAVDKNGNASEPSEIASETAP